VGKPGQTSGRFAARTAAFTRPPSLWWVSDSIRDLPDALVLGAGGTLGEAWLRGVLNGLETGSGLDFGACEYLLGTSAGSIVAATLAAGKRPEAGARRGEASSGDEASGRARRGEASSGDEASGRGSAAHAAAPLPSPAGEADVPARGSALGAVGRGAARVGRAIATPFAPLALATTAPAGRLARAAVLSRAPRPDRTLGDLGGYIDKLGLRFDGRLRIFAVDRATGKRVIFGAPDAPRATVAEAVLASCAVPWIFAPVEIGGREYVDGGVWSPTNLDAVPAGRGVRVLCLIPTVGAAMAPLRTVSAAAAGYEGMALRARGADVRTVVPDDASLDAIGPNLMDPSRRAQVAAAGYAQGRRLSGGT
jgi:NTE family protein